MKESNANNDVNDVNQAVNIVSKKPETAIFTARIDVNDKIFITDFIKQFKNQTEGVNNLVNIVKQAQTNESSQDVYNSLQDEYNKLQEVYNSLQDEYRNLKLVNNALQDNFNCLQAEQIELPTEIIVKLNTLRRYLKQKQRIPADASSKEFLNQFIIMAVNTFLTSKYSFLK